MKKLFLDKSSVQLGVISSSLYLTSSVCPCCGRPSVGCLSGLGGAILIGGGVWGVNLLSLYLGNKMAAFGSPDDLVAK